MKKKLAYGIGLLLLASGCSNDEPDLKTEGNVELSLETMQMIDSSLKSFSDDMMMKALEYWKESGAENKTISPLGAAMNLGMLAAGSSGDNLTEILGAFGDNINVEQLTSTLGELMEKLPLRYDENASIKLANSVWANQTNPLNDSYVSDLKKYFQATASVVDLGSTSGKTEINDWVNRQTEGALKDIFEPVSADFLMLNTLLFKARWSYKFDPNNTQPGTFHNYDGTESTVDMMSAFQTVLYCESEDILMIRVLLRSGCALNIIMPKTEDVKIVPEFLWLRGWMKGFEGLETLKPLDTKLTLPKFTIANKTDLIPILRKMGLRSIFTPTGGFADMFSGPSSQESKSIGVFDQTISTVLNERGAVVASVTETGLLTSANPSLKKPERIDIDRPFIFTIVDYNSRVILEMGCVNKL